MKRKISTFVIDACKEEGFTGITKMNAIKDAANVYSEEVLKEEVIIFPQSVSQSFTPNST